MTAFQSLLSAVLAVLMAPTTAAASASQLEAVPVSVINAGTEPVSCQAEIAHWFSAELARIAPGRTSLLDLWRDPVTGSHATRNEHGEFLPVERAWCGIEGRAYVTRWQITLTSSSREGAASRQLTCTTAGDRLACR